MIRFNHSGSFNRIEKFFKQASNIDNSELFERYGKQGVSALASATPIDSGETATSWNYEVVRSGSSVKIVWTNSNVVSGVPVAVLIQYGHGTRNGGYVQGRDFINPAIRPVFDSFANDIWREVTK